MAEGKKILLSGVQPSGRIHIGNYFGAIRQHIELANDGNAFFFIADYHALNTVHDPEVFAGLVRDVALDYLQRELEENQPVPGALTTTAGGHLVQFVPTTVLTPGASDLSRSWMASQTSGWIRGACWPG